jgi:hypothetical protein
MLQRYKFLFNKRAFSAIYFPYQLRKTVNGRRSMRNEGETLSRSPRGEKMEKTPSVPLFRGKIGRRDEGGRI